MVLNGALNYGLSLLSFNLVLFVVTLLESVRWQVNKFNPKVDSTLNSHDVYAQTKSLLQHSGWFTLFSGESDYIISKQLDMVIKVNGGLSFTA